MDFSWGGVWGMGYGRFMGYVMHFPMNQLGGCKMLWGLRGYGFSEVWVKRGLTVIKFFVYVSLCQNKVSTTLNHCLIIVAAENQG